MNDFAVVELHNAHGGCRSPLVGDCVFRDPEIPVSENPLDVEAGRLAGMMTPQGLQIASPEDSLARLGIITNGIVIVNIVFRVLTSPFRPFGEPTLVSFSGSTLRLTAKQLI